MSSPIETTVFQTISDVLNVPLPKVARDTSPQSVEGWDSVQHLNLVLALEQALGVQFAPEEFESMQSAGAIVDLVAKKRK